VPRIERNGAVARLPKGFATIVNVFWKPSAKITWPEFRTSAWARLEPDNLVVVTFPAGYTPVPYAPQIAAALIGRLNRQLPIITFYLGRIFNALAYIGIIGFAIRITPMLKWLFAAAALVPMALYLAASWSPDAMTIAAAFFFTAALLRGARTSRDVALLATAGAFVGLCKPAYFLIALLALVIPATRGAMRAIIIAATAVGVVLAMWNAAHAFVVPAIPGVRADPPAQIDCLRRHPERFAEALRYEMRDHGAEYIEQAVGRLGLLDVFLPPAVKWAELLLLVLCAWSTPIAPSPPVRVAALLISLVTVTGIALSAYHGWTPPCATSIEGIQGRYFLPIVPLMFLTISAPLVRREAIPRIAIGAVAIASNAIALFAVAGRYYL
jgi:uncharacterized membrane protein